MLQGMVPLAALYCIRYPIGYETYLTELAEKQHRDKEELLAVLDILQSLAAAGLVPFDAAVYIIMGQNIGTCVTAIMSSIGAKKTAKTAAAMPP